MFDNIGRKIRGLARVVLLVGLVLSGIGMIGMWITGMGLGDHAGGFTIFIVGLLIGGLGCLCAWAGGCLIAGFGQLVEDIEAIRHNTEDTQYCAENLRRMAEEYRRNALRAREQEEQQT